jgi:hypothetical protein
MAVLLIVPSIVIFSSLVLTAFLNVFEDNAGFPERILFWD